MSDFFLELYSEEIPPQLQIDARTQLKDLITKHLKEDGISFKDCCEFSSPTRLGIYLKGIPDKIKIRSREIKGPKTGVSTNIIEAFAKSHDVTKQSLFIKKTDKGEFYFTKTKEKIILVENLMKENIPKILSSISWKKSMKWSTNDMLWGRPLRSIHSSFNGKKLYFKYHHLETTDNIIIEQDLIVKSKKS